MVHRGLWICINIWRNQWFDKLVSTFGGVNFDGGNSSNNTENISIGEGNNKLLQSAQTSNIFLGNNIFKGTHRYSSSSGLEFNIAIGQDYLIQVH